MKRREFGRRILEASAALGLTRIGATRLSGLGLSLGACEDLPIGDLDAGGIDGGDEPGQSPIPQTADGKSVLIIGSGYGAAVTALRLTERGIPVTILERGRMWDTKAADGKVFCSVFEPDGRAMWFKDRTEVVVKNFLGIFPTSFSTPAEAGVIDVSGPLNMRAFRGAGVGGGSLVNLAVFVTPEREILQRQLPDVDMDAMYDTYYPRAKETLRTARVPDRMLQDEVYRYARVGADAAKAAGFAVSTVESGYDYAYLQREIAGTVPQSASIGEGGFGNNYGKNSLDKTYLADAMGTGKLTIRMLHDVKRVRLAPGGGYVVEVDQIDIQGHVRQRHELVCTHLFIGAGSIASSELMVRARDRGDLPNLNMHVGTQWGPNSDIFVARDNPLWMPTGAVQCTVPGTTFKTRDQDGRHLFSMIIPFPVGIETFISFNIVMADNPEAGRFQYDSIADKVNLLWYPEQNEPAVTSTRFVFDKINLASGTTYTEGMFDAPVIGDRATYHPVGGMPLGKATDAYGRIVGHPGLYVVDSALIPVGICANPALTTAALAERNVERIVAEDFGR